MTVKHARAGLATFVMLSLAIPATSAQEPVAIDSQAEHVLRQMSDYLGSLKSFTFRSDNTADMVMPSGQQLQVGGHAKISIRRPDRFRVSRKGDLGEQEFYFDGQTLTLFGKRVNYYAQMKASKSTDVDTALDFAREEVGVIAPASDLIYQDAYQGLMEDVTSGTYVGAGIVGGAEVHHLAFRGDEVDWQIWIDKGDMPLPRKLLITSKWITGAPQYTAVFSDWNTSAQLDDALFTFSPPPGAEEIGFIPLRGASAPGD